jgi:hypothetical protein
MLVAGEHFLGKALAKEEEAEQSPNDPESRVSPQGAHLASG